MGSEVKNITAELPFKIPNNWCWARFKTVLDIRDGTHDSPKYYSEGVPFVTSKCLKNNTIDFSLCKLISLEDSKRFNERSCVDDKDILFAMIGTIGNATIVNKDREFSIKNVALFKNINRQLLSEKFIKYLLDCLTCKMIEKTSSGLQPFVSLDFLRNYIIPIPPIQEQIKIIIKLDNIFGKLITIQDDRNSLLSFIDNVKNKVLDYYFGENSCYKSYYENKFTTIGQILNFERGASPRPIKSFIAKDGINWIKISDGKLNDMYIESTQEKITIDGAKKSRSVSCGELILSNSMSYGKPYILKINGCIHDGWYVFRKNENIDVKFLYFFLISGYAQNQIKNYASGSTVSNISSDLMKKIAITIYDIPTQKLIVEQIEKNLTIINKIKEQLI